MVRFIQILIIVESIIQRLLRLFGLILLLLSPFMAGCDESENARREREHVNAMQQEVTKGSRELVAADSQARKGLMEAQKSFEETRRSIAQQQADVQSGLDRLETERKTVAASRVTDLLISGSIESIGSVAACLVPLLILGWLMQRFSQTDSVPEVDAMIVSQLEWPAHSLNKPMTDGCEKTSPKLIAARSQFPNQSDSYDSWRPDE